MCGIVGSPVLSDGARMATALKSRGTRAWSITVIDMNTLRVVHTHTSPRVYDESELPLALEEYARSIEASIDPFYIWHLQSPTSADHKYHPAVFMGPNNTEHYLWHNGMIDSSEHAKYGRTWDTQILLESFIGDNGNPNFGRLGAFQGSFACYYLNSGEGLYMFRNRISPQYFDGAYYSSMPFEGSAKAEPNTVYLVPSNAIAAHFENNYNPFGV